MKILAIAGKADKRILAYPLMKTCALLGHTLVATDDISYRRLYAGMEKSGSIGDVKIVTVPEINADSCKDIEEMAKEEETDILLYLTEGYIPWNTGAASILFLADHTFCGIKENIFYEEEESAADMIPADCGIKRAILSIEPEPKKSWKLPVALLKYKQEHVYYILSTEEKRILMPLRDKEINAYLTDAFSNYMGLKPAAMKKILGRKLM